MQGSCPDPLVVSILLHLHYSTYIHIFSELFEICRHRVPFTPKSFHRHILRTRTFFYMTMLQGLKLENSTWIQSIIEYILYTRILPLLSINPVYLAAPSNGTFHNDGKGRGTLKMYLVSLRKSTFYFILINFNLNSNIPHMDSD